MHVSDFEIKNLENPLRNPHCIATLAPWINVGNVGKNVVRRLSEMYSMVHIGNLLNPSNFYDFTRYRPEIFIKTGLKSTKIPNTNVSLIKDFHDRDLVIIEILEPHALAEKFNDSLLMLFEQLKIERYILLGSMYDSVPHTRPLTVTGSSKGWDESFPDDVKISESSYVGPTSLISRIGERVQRELKIETLSLIVHLPLYLKIDDDYFGASKLLSVLSSLYGFSNNLPELGMGEKQYSQVDSAISANPSLKSMIKKFEENYDKSNVDTEIKPADLSPDIEQFLKDVARKPNND
jgi:hypothetical protein